MAVTTCDRVPWVGSSKLCLVQLTLKHPGGGGSLLGADLVVEKIADLLSVVLFPFHSFCSLHDEVQVFSAELIQPMNCIRLYLHKKFLSTLWYWLAAFLPSARGLRQHLASWTHSPLSIFPTHSLCKDFTHTDCPQHWVSDVPDPLKSPSPRKLLPVT